MSTAVTTLPLCVATPTVHTNVFVSLVILEMDISVQVNFSGVSVCFDKSEKRITQ